MERNEVVALQDRDVLLKMHPVLTPESNNHEFFVGADSPIARYREFLKDWEAAWLADRFNDAVERNRRRVAYAIPSARRDANTRAGYWTPSRFARPGRPMPIRHAIRAEVAVAVIPPAQAEPRRPAAVEALQRVETACRHWHL